VLGRPAAEGLIRLDDGHIVVSDEARLAERAEGST
jgi:hypothetical protein